MPYTEHPEFCLPERDRTIWRYIDFTKLVSLLEKQALFFARADLLAGVLAAVRGRNHERLAVDHEASVAEEAFVEDSVYSFAIVNRTIGFADHTGARGGHLRFRHWGTNSGQAPKDERKV